MSRIVVYGALFVLLAMCAAAAPCDFAWNAANPSYSCTTSGVQVTKQYGGIASLQYSAVSHSFNLGVDNSGTATDLPIYKTAYYTVKDGTGPATGCTLAFGVAPNNYKWCPFTLSASAGPYAFDVGGGSMWFNAKAGTISMQNLPVSGDHVAGDNFLAVFMCGCTGTGCTSQENWECNARSATQKGVRAGRWIIMPFGKCTAGETKSTGCDVNGAGCTASFWCNSGQWTAMTVTP